MKKFLKLPLIVIFTYISIHQNSILLLFLCIPLLIWIDVSVDTHEKLITQNSLLKIFYKVLYGDIKCVEVKENHLNLRCDVCNREKSGYLETNKIHHYSLFRKVGETELDNKKYCEEHSNKDYTEEYSVTQRGIMSENNHSKKLITSFIKNIFLSYVALLFFSIVLPLI